MFSRLKKLYIAAAASLCCLGPLPADADFHPYTWQITIETEEIPNSFKYKDSKLTPLVKARVSYTKADGSTENTDYETIWFCKGRAFGLERQGMLDIGVGQSVGVRVTHKTRDPNDYDCMAAASSILRILLDVRTGHNSLQSVTVPDGTYSGISSALSYEHYQSFYAPLETPYQIAGGLFIQDESKRHSEMLCYAPNSAGY